MTPRPSRTGSYTGLDGWARKQSMISGSPPSRVQVRVNRSWSHACSRTSRAAASSVVESVPMMPGVVILTGSVIWRLLARRPKGRSPSRIKFAT